MVSLSLKTKCRTQAGEATLKTVLDETSINLQDEEISITRAESILAPSIILGRGAVVL